MKNKVLASLLAVCLFVGLAVPAFAGTTSSQEGTSDQVTALAFRDASYEVKEGDTLDLSGKVIAYCGDKTSTLTPSLTWSSTDNLAAIVDSNGMVSGITKGKTATVTVTSTDGKGSAKATIKVVPVLTINATGIKLDGTPNIPTATAIGDYAALETFTYVLTVPDLKSGAKPSLTVGGTTVTGDAAASDLSSAATIAALFAGKTATIKNTTYDVTNTSDTVVFTAKATQGDPKTNSFPTDKKFDSKAVVRVAPKAANGKTSEEIAPTAQKMALPQNKEIKIVATPADSVLTSAQDTAVDNAALTTESDLNAVYGSGFVTYNAADNKFVFDCAGMSVPNSVKATMKVTLDKSFPSPVVDGAMLSAKASMNLNTVAIKAPAVVVTPGAIKIEVGQQYTIKPTLSNSNQTVSYDYGEDVVGDNSYYDYAIVSADGDGNGLVTAIAVGTNKIVTTASNGMSSTTVVEVVAKGTLPTTDPDKKVSITPINFSATVGNPVNIAIKNAEGKAFSYTSLIPSIATVDATGKVTPVAPGLVKIAVKVGDETFYATVTVVAAPITKPGEGGTTPVPPTGVVLLGQLF